MIEINDDKQESVVLEEDINNKKEEKKQQDDYEKIIIFLDKKGCKGNPFSQDKRFFSYDEQMMNGIPITYVDNEEKGSDIGNGFKVVNCKGNNDNNVIYYNYKDDKDWQGKELKERIIFIGKNNNEIYDGFDEDILKNYPNLSQTITTLLTQYNTVLPSKIIQDLKNLIKPINIQTGVSIIDRNIKNSKRKHFYDIFLKEYLKKPWIILLQDKYVNGFSKDTRHFIADGKIVEITDEDCKKGFKKIVCKQLQYSDVPNIGGLTCGERSRDGRNYDNRATINLPYSQSKVLFVDESNQIFSSRTGSEFLYDGPMKLGVYSMKDRLDAGFNTDLYIAYNKTLQEIGDDFKKRFSAEEREKLDSQYSLEDYNKYKDEQQKQAEENNKEEPDREEELRSEEIANQDKDSSSESNNIIANIEENTNEEAIKNTIEEEEEITNQPKRTIKHQQKLTNNKDCKKPLTFKQWLQKKNKQKKEEQKKTKELSKKIRKYQDNLYNHFDSNRCIDIQDSYTNYKPPYAEISNRMSSHNTHFDKGGKKIFYDKY